MSRELLKIQQGTLTLIKREIKETRLLIKSIKKDSKATGSNQIYQDVKLTCKQLEMSILSIEREINELKFKNATPDSVFKLRESYQMVKEQNEFLKAAYNEFLTGA